jgi:hypothetical protein
MKKKPLTPEQRKARMKNRTIPNGKEFASCLNPNELYLKIQATKACRHVYGCTPLEAEQAFTAANREGWIKARKGGIGLAKDTPVYLVDQKQGLVEKPKQEG